ncbi:MAG TPA: hypothetical protein K8V85_10800 [Staphylococcus kloosii]|uniref:Uncharacterized protein n=1 Tax=Staphylococcus kloosii TaxID=29384 RepID=A0A921H1A1_9STAP|nr:hypothetical protein [Staphylococcus kloosii]HJF68790.1 hypothetical protein [Staphylococcus kloosii]
MVEGARKVVSLLSIVAGLIFGGIFVLVAIGQLLGFSQSDGMLVNLIVGGLIMFAGCIFLPRLIYRFTEDMVDGGTSFKGKNKTSNFVDRVGKRNYESESDDDEELESLEEVTMNEEKAFSKIGEESKGEL